MQTLALASALATGTSYLWPTRLAVSDTASQYLLSGAAQSTAAVFGIVLTLSLILGQASTYRLPTSYLLRWNWRNACAVAFSAAGILVPLILLALEAYEFSLAAILLTAAALGFVLLAARHGGLGVIGFFTYLADNPAARYLNDVSRICREAATRKDEDTYSRGLRAMDAIANANPDRRESMSTEAILASDSDLTFRWFCTFLRYATSPLAFSFEDDDFTWLDDLKDRLTPQFVRNRRGRRLRSTPIRLKESLDPLESIRVAEVAAVLLQEDTPLTSAQSRTLFEQVLRLAWDWEVVRVARTENEDWVAADLAALDPRDQLLWILIAVETTQEQASLLDSASMKIQLEQSRMRPIIQRAARETEDPEGLSVSLFVEPYELKGRAWNRLMERLQGLLTYAEKELWLEYREADRQYILTPSSTYVSALRIRSRGNDTFTEEAAAQIRVALRELRSNPNNASNRVQLTRLRRLGFFVSDWTSPTGEPFGPDEFDMLVRMSAIRVAPTAGTSGEA